MAYPQALAVTLAVEVPVYVLALGLPRAGVFGPGNGMDGSDRIARPARIIGRNGFVVALLAIAVNLVTHPVVWWVLTRVDGGRIVFVAVEAGAWLAETALLWLALRRDLALLALTALVANTASLTAGLAFTGLR